MNIDPKKSQRRNVIPQSVRLEPYHQGSLDALCGLYSAINAIRVAAYPAKRLTRHHIKYLMGDGIDYLARAKCLTRVLKDGMSFSIRVKLTNHLIKRVRQRWGLEILKLKPNRNADLIKFIEGEVDQGHPVCIHVYGLYDHYTVISGYTPKQLKLYDSNGRQFFRRDSVSIVGDDRESGHQIMPTGVFSLSVADTTSR